MHTTLPITPTHAFARQLLGAIGSATAEQIKRSKRGLAAGDLVGQWGLEQQFDQHLAGSASYHVITRDRVTGDAIQTLASHQGRAPARAAHDALDAGPERRRGGARHVDRAVGDRRRAALDGRHPRGREPPDRGHLRPRARRRLRARLDLQGDHDRGAARARRSTRTPPSRARPRSWSTAAPSRTSRARAAATRRSTRTSRSRATRPSSRSRRELAATALTKTALEFGLGQEQGSAVRHRQLARAAEHATPSATRR